MSGAHRDGATISSRSNVNIPITGIAGLVLGFGLYLFADIQASKKETDRRFDALHREFETKQAAHRALIDTKADKGQAQDRWTGKQQDEYRTGMDTRIGEIQKTNAAEHGALRREIDHIHDMIEGCCHD